MASPAVSSVAFPAAESTLPPAATSSLWPADLSRWYLPEEDDDVGISYQTLLVLHALLSAMRQWVEEEGKAWLVGSEQDMLLREDDQRVGVRPDAYLLPCIPEDLTFERWPAYQEGMPVPVLAVEFVSPSNWKKDYEEAPEKYTALGVEELVLVDLLAARGESRAKEAEVLQVYRRGGGKLERVYAGPGPARSEVMGVWWREEGGAILLTRDREGKERLPTKEEAESGKRRAAEEKARTEAKARQIAEEGKRTAEEKAKEAEEAQQSAHEKAKAAEEKARAEEQAREVAEEAKRRAEAKVKAEAEARQAAEEAKKAAESKAQREAETRQAAEQAHHNAEQARLAAEEAKKDAETKARNEALARLAAEQARKDAEQQALLEARLAVADLCDLLDLEWTEERRQQVDSLDLPALRQLRAALKLHKRWPA